MRRMRCTNLTTPSWVYTYWYMQKIKIENHTFSGGMWAAAWLFTIGYLKLTFWQGVLAVIIWPYYLGHFFTVIH